MMKLIDEKGRLFGLLNVIDFMVLFFVMGLLPMSYYTYKIYKRTQEISRSAAINASQGIQVTFSRGEAPLASEPVLVVQPTHPEYKIFSSEIKCRFIELKAEDSEKMRVGDKMIDASGDTIAKILSLSEIEPYEELMNVDSKNQIFRSLHLKQRFATVYLKVRKEDTGFFTLTNQPISGGSKIDLKFSNSEIKCVVVNSTQKSKTRWVRVRLESTVTHRVAKLIHAGTEQKNPSTDEVIARIRSIQKNVPRESYMINPEGRFISVQHPTDRLLVFDVDLKVREVGNYIYFEEFSLEIDSQMKLHTPIYSLSGTVLEVFRDKKS